MNKNNYWDDYEAEFKKKFAEKDLKDSKRNSIAMLESQGKYASRKEQFHAHWETYLSFSDYWKNWQERINSFQTEKEVDFYANRLSIFIEFVEKYTKKDVNRYSGRVIEGAKQWDPINTPKLIKQELKRLENISEEEFKKTDKWGNSGEFKELSAKEMLNDPWFSNKIDKFFGLENGKLPKKEEKSVENDSGSNVGYQTWTKEQFIAEINRLKAENEELKNNQTLTSSERQARLQQNQNKLEKIEGYLGVNSNSKLNNSNKKSNKDINGTVGIIAIISIISALLIASVVVAKKQLNKKS